MDMLINHPLLNFLSFLIGIVGIIFAVSEVVRAGNYKRVVKSWGMSTVKKLTRVNNDLVELDQKISRMEATEWRGAATAVQAEIHNHAVKTEEIADDLKNLFTLLKKERRPTNTLQKKD